MPSQPHELLFFKCFMIKITVSPSGGWGRKAGRYELLSEVELHKSVSFGGFSVHSLKVSFPTFAKKKR